MFKKSLLCAFLVCSAFFPAHAQTKKPVAKVIPKPETEVTQPSGSFQGTFKETLYRNDFFGFALYFPSDWFVQKTENDPPNSKNSSGSNAKALFAVSLKPLGSPNNAIFVGATENLKDYPNVTNGKEYLEVFLKNLKKNQKTDAFEIVGKEEIQTAIFAETEFAYLKLEKSSHNEIIYAFVREDHAVYFVLNYSNDDDLKTMQKVLDDGNFWIDN